MHNFGTCKKNADAGWRLPITKRDWPQICRNLPMRRGILFVRTAVVRRPPSDSHLHFDITNIWQICTQKQNASAWRLHPADMFECCPKVCHIKITFTSLLTNCFVSTTPNSIKSLVNWILLRICVRSKNTQPHLDNLSYLSFLFIFNLFVSSFRLPRFVLNIQVFSCILHLLSLLIYIFHILVYWDLTLIFILNCYLYQYLLNDWLIYSSHFSMSSDLSEPWWFKTFLIVSGQGGAKSVEVRLYDAYMCMCMCVCAYVCVRMCVWWEYTYMDVGILLRSYLQICIYIYIYIYVYIYMYMYMFIYIYVCVYIYICT